MDSQSLWSRGPLKMHRKLLIFLAGLAAGLPLAPILTHLDGGSAGLPDIPLVRAPAFSDSAQLLLTSALPPQDPAMLSRVIPAVVRVTGPAFAGSGVIVTPSGAVLTSAHVVGEAAQVGVVVEDNRSVTGRVVLADAKRDLAPTLLCPWPAARRRPWGPRPWPSAIPWGCPALPA
jgi:S1-C subfamily serine protease